MRKFHADWMLAMPNKDVTIQVFYQAGDFVASGQTHVIAVSLLGRNITFEAGMRVRDGRAIGTIKELTDRGFTIKWDGGFSSFYNFDKVAYLHPITVLEEIAMGVERNGKD